VRMHVQMGQEKAGGGGFGHVPQLIVAAGPFVARWIAYDYDPESEISNVNSRIAAAGIFIGPGAEAPGAP